MTLKLSELRKIHRGLPRPQHCGDYRCAIARQPPCVDWSAPFSKFETIEELTFRAEWGEDPETHAPKLVWHLRGKHDIIFDLDLTRSQSVLP